MIIDPDKVSAVIAEAAEQYILPRYNLLQQSEIHAKSGPNDLVTIADQETEEALEKALSGLYPGAVVIGEESISAGIKSLQSLQEKTAGNVVFVADPVDGTWNFVHGKREFCVMLACVIDGQTCYGWIYDVLDRKMMAAEKGAGAYWGGDPMKVAQARPHDQLIGHAGQKYFPAPMREYIKSYQQHVKKLKTLSCAGHEYLRLASGLSDFGIYSRIRPWDHLAGALAVQEAGGYIAQWDGTPYTPRDEFGGLVVASNKDLWQDLHSRLIKPMTESVN